MTLSSFSEEKGGDNPALSPYTPSVQVEASDMAVAQEAQPVSTNNIRRVIREILETIVLTLVIFFVIQMLVRNFRVVGTSMEPNLHNGQYLIIDKVSYYFSDPQVGDVVVFEPPNRPGEDYVKRIIGLPGQVVEIRNGQVFIDNKPLEEPYTVRRGSYSMEPRLVGPDEYFVLGDNRDSSSDSHMWGMLPRANIVGRAWISYWPPSSWGLITRDAPTSTTTLFYWLSTLLGLGDQSSKE